MTLEKFDKYTWKRQDVHNIKQAVSLPTACLLQIILDSIFSSLLM